MMKKNKNYVVHIKLEDIVFVCMFKATDYLDLENRVIKWAKKLGVIESMKCFEYDEARFTKQGRMLCGTFLGKEAIKEIK